MDEAHERRLPVLLLDASSAAPDPPPADARFRTTRHVGGLIA
jgi:hypothetical protein